MKIEWIETKRNQRRNEELIYLGFASLSSFGRCQLPKRINYAKRKHEESATMKKGWNEKNICVETILRSFEEVHIWLFRRHSARYSSSKLTREKRWIWMNEDVADDGIAVRTKYSRLHLIIKNWKFSFRFFFGQTMEFVNDFFPAMPNSVDVSFFKKKASSQRALVRSVGRMGTFFNFASSSVRQVFNSISWCLTAILLWPNENGIVQLRSISPSSSCVILFLFHFFSFLDFFSALPNSSFSTVASLNPFCVCCCFENRNVKRSFHFQCISIFI